MTNARLLVPASPRVLVSIVLLTVLSSGFKPAQICSAEKASALLPSGAACAEYVLPEREGIAIIDGGRPELEIESEVRVGEWVGSVAFAVTLSAASTIEVTATYATRDGTAIAGADYEAVSGTLRIAPGETVGTITVPILYDNVREGEETFTLTLSRVENAVLGSGMSTGIILDNETMLSLSIDGFPEGRDAGIVVDTVTQSGQRAAAKLHIAEPVISRAGLFKTSAECQKGPFGYVLKFTEGDTCTYEFTCQHTDGSVAVRDHYINIKLADGTATAGEDFTLPDPTRVFWEEGALQSEIGEVSFEILQDEEVEGFEDLNVYCQRDEDGARPGPLYPLLIRDDDGEISTPTLLVRNASASEDAGNMGFGFRLSLTERVYNSVSMTMKSSTEAGDTATEGVDYQAWEIPWDLHWGERAGLHYFNVFIYDDALVEGNETFTFTVEDIKNATPSMVTAEGIIVDNDFSAAVTMSIADMEVKENAGPASLRVTLSPASEDAVTVRYATSEGTARANQDYLHTSGTLTIPAGETVADIEVAILNDLEVESDETFFVTLTDPAGADLSRATATVTIIDNDVPALSIGDVRVEEDAGPASLRVSLRSASNETVTVRYATSEGTAGADYDYLRTSGTLTIPAGETEAHIEVDILDDLEEESDETFFVTLTGPVRAELSRATARVTIIDDDFGATVTMSIGDVEVEEDAGPASLRVSLRSVLNEMVTVRYATSDGTAGADYDYLRTSGTLTIPAGETEAHIEVDILDDLEVESDETFFVTLTDPAGVDLSRATATVTIIDNDVPALSIGDVRVEEDTGPASLRVSLSSASNETVTVRYATSDGTATVDQDYLQTSGTLTIPAGETEADIEVDILDDLEVESDETFFVTLTDPAGVDLSRATATVTIIDDDVPALSIDDVRVEEDAGPASLRVSLSSASNETVTVRYATSDGTATVDQDYLQTSGTLTIPAGETEAHIEVDVLDDLEVESDETFFVTLTDPAGVDLSRTTATVTIIDNDVPALSIDDVRVEEDDVRAVFTVSLNAAWDSPVTVEYVTMDGTATAGQDYLPVISGELVIPPGQLSGQVEVMVIDDFLLESDETFTLVLSNPGGVELADETGEATILDNDLYRLHVDDVTVSEGGGAARFTVSLVPANPVQTVRVAYATADGTAMASADYVSASGSLVFTPGETVQTLAVQIQDDAVDEPDETFVVSLDGAENATIARPEATGTIIDNDAPPVVSIVSAVRVGEADGSALFPVLLSAASAFVVTVSYATGDGTALAGQDYVTQRGTLELAPGETEGMITVLILDDAIREPDETFTLTLSGVRNAGLGLAVSTGTIVDDEAVPTLRVGDVTVKEDARSAVFPVTLGGESATAVQVAYATVDETATAGADYTATSGTLVFAPREVTREIVVGIVSDDLDEPDETFLVRLSEALEAELADATGRGTITDDDEPVTISIYDGRGLEDAGLLHLPVRLSRKSSRVVSVFFGTSDITAEAGVDYVTSRGIVVFEHGSTEGVVAISMQSDALNEEDETFHATLSRPTNALIARGVATGTIEDNDGIPMLRVGDITASEDGGEAIFRVTLSVPGTRLVTVAYRTFDGSAEAGRDYVEASGTLAFAPGEVEQEVRVQLLRDGRDWRVETFSLALESVSNAMLDDAVATATIVEEESIEDGVLTAHVARFLRTSASHVVEAMEERLKWMEMDPACAPVTGERLQMMRYANPSWNPSGGELLSGCGMVVTGGGFGVWGRGAFTRLNGKEGMLSLRADVTTGALGADYRWESGLMAGLLFSHSQAAGTFEAYAATGETESRLTGAYPYVTYRTQSVRLWALGGLGRGSAEVDGSEYVEAQLTSSLVAAGAVGTLLRGRRTRLSYTADAFLVRGNPEERVSVRVSRIRAGLEGSVLLSRSLHPYVEVAVRRDGGDAETGLGLEVGGGLRLSTPGSRLRAEVRTRGLVTHAQGGFTEWGVAAAVRYGAPQGVGPTAEIRPAWGPARSGGMQALWRHDSVVDAAISPPGQKRIEMRFGYGTLLQQGNGIVRPILAVTLRDRGRDYRVGYEVSMQNGLVLSASGVARETADPWQPVLYGISARTTLRW